MSDVTRILSQIDSGDTSAAEQLLLLIYDELRKRAAVIASESISTSWLDVWASTNLVMQVEVLEQFPSTNQASG